MIDKITNLLKEKFKGNKQEAQKFLSSLGFKNWNDVKNSDNERLAYLFKVLDDLQDNEYIVVKLNDTVITRPKKPKSIKDIHFIIK